MKKILVVDDEATNLLIIEELLNDDYELKCLELGTQVKDALLEFLPDIILLDINMPVMDGYEVCSWLKEQSEYEHIPVVFVSAKDSIDERMHGYEVGGYDYITKPFDCTELSAKIGIIIKNMNEIGSLKNDCNSAFSTAMQAMSGAGELGVVMQFLDKIISCTNFDELIDQMFASLNAFGLDSSVQIRFSDKDISRSSNGEINPLEVELLTKVRKKGRFVDAGCRTFVNYERISILINNMPIDDEVLYGRVKDNIPPMLNGAEARIIAIETEIQLKQKQEILKKAMEKTHYALSIAKERVNELKEHNSEVMEGLISKIDAELLSLNLTDQKERYLMKMLESNKSKLASSYDDGIKIEAIFQRIIGKLSAAVD